MKRYEEAIKAYDEVLKINPQYAKAEANREVAQKALGKNDEENKADDKELKIYPEDIDAENGIEEPLSQKAPGFEIISAIAGLAMITYLLKRRK